MSSKLICQKTEMSPNLKCHKNWSFTKTELSPKLKCHQNWNVTKTEMLPYIIFVLKNKNKNSRDRHWIPWSCFQWIVSKLIYINRPSVSFHKDVWCERTTLYFREIEILFLFIYLFIFFNFVMQYFVGIFSEPPKKFFFTYKFRNGSTFDKTPQKIDLEYLFKKKINGFKGQLGRSSFMELMSFFSSDFVMFFFAFAGWFI